MIKLSSILALAGVLLATPAQAAAAATPVGHPGISPLGKIDFATQVMPIIQQSCVECHSQEKRKGGLTLEVYGDILDGGKDGPVVMPGNPENSMLLDRITGKEDPAMPKDKDPLKPEEIEIIRTWIAQGARPTANGDPAPQPWIAPLELKRPAAAKPAWRTWNSTIDSYVAAYLQKRKVSQPKQVSDEVFARRVYFDAWGFPPSPEALRAFAADRASNKRETLVDRLLADSDKYQENWITYWNDLLRNDDGATYFSDAQGGARQSITPWLQAALRTNLPYDEMVRKLVNPAAPGDPAGFVIGVNWRGETNPAVSMHMQAAQNSAQIFLGVNLKCNACHDSFINQWKLRDSYSLAAYFSADSYGPNLQLVRCEVPQVDPRTGRPITTSAAFLFPELEHAPVSDALGDRRAAAAASFTDPRNGRLPRTLVNRLWHKLMGYGIVALPDEMDGRPWSPDLLDALASDFVESKYDLKKLIREILVSQAYQMPAVARKGEMPNARNFVFNGPEVRRLTGEQFSDAVGAITGEWSRFGGRGRGVAAPAAPAAGGRGRGNTAAASPPFVSFGREWRNSSTALTRAMGRPIRDQVISVRPSTATTIEALELENGELLTSRLLAGARDMIGQGANPAPLLLGQLTSAEARGPAFEVDVSGTARIYLAVQDSVGPTDSVLPAWSGVQLVGKSGAVPLSSLPRLTEDGVRAAAGDLLQVKNPSVVAYDISGRGFTRLRGSIALEAPPPANPAAAPAATSPRTINYAVYDAEPLAGAPVPTTPLPRFTKMAKPSQVVDRVFQHALGRPPSNSERALAVQAITDPGTESVSAEGLADLLWAIFMKPEFQLIY